MGSSISAIYDDMDIYSALCKEHNEKEDKLYSNHYYWLVGKNRGEITIDFKEYDRLEKIRLNKIYIANHKADIKNIQDKIKELQKENHSLIYNK